MDPSYTVVIKVGTSTLTDAQTGTLALSAIAGLVESLCQLQRQGHQVILVSSGAVGVGCSRLSLRERPKTMSMKQAVAAVGQGRLIRVYDDLFSTLGQPIAQVLLTRSDLVQRSRYVNSYRTFRQLLKLGVVPIVNENDTVAVEELRFGDNDTLSALVASLVGADWLFLLTDVDRLYSADPRNNPDAQPIDRIESLEDLADLNISVGDRGTQWGTGGMLTKLQAARIATTAGVRTIITEGRRPENVGRILAGENLGTQFEPHPGPSTARKRWIAHSLIPAGKLYLDGGAVQAICKSGKSLLAAGITEVEGEFQTNEAVQLCSPDGVEVARGIVNYSHRELSKILGQRSDEIVSILGYTRADTVVHRNNMVLASPPPPLESA